MVTISIVFKKQTNLTACRKARLAFQDDFRTLRGGLDDFSDDEDGVV